MSEPADTNWKKMNVQTYECRSCGHTTHGDEAEAAANAESVRMAKAVVSASEAYKRLAVIEYLAGDGSDAPRANGKRLARLTREQTDVIRDCLREITGTGDDAKNRDAAQAEMRGRLENADRIAKGMLECAKRHGGHHVEGDYCTNCGKPRWDLTREEREAAGLS